MWCFFMLEEQMNSVKKTSERYSALFNISVYIDNIRKNDES